MILLDNEVVSAKDVADRFKVPFDKIQKTRQFDMNPDLFKVDIGESSQQRRKVLKRPSGKQFPAGFIFKDEDGIDHELRYCNRKPTKKEIKGSGIQEVYSPRKLRVEGEGTLADNLDIAVILYLNPRCRQSPFRESSVWLYEYFDSQEKAQAQIESISTLRKALDHAATISGTDRVLFAKGIGIADVSNKTGLVIQGELSMLAAQNPDFYIEKMNSKSVFLDGRIRDCVDLGIFVEKRSGNVRTWKWGKGHYKGSDVVSVLDINADSFDVLKSYLKSPENINDYYEELMSVHKSVTADLTAEEFLSHKDGSAPLGRPVSADGNTPMPTNFEEAKEYLTRAHPQGKNASMQKASQFLSAITSGEVTPENIGVEAQKYISKVE